MAPVELSHYRVVEVCAGAGGQSLRLEQAGFSHAAAVEIDQDACETLRQNRQHVWKVIEADVHHFDGRPYHGIDLLAGGFRARRSRWPAGNSALTMSVTCSRRRCAWSENASRRR
jgi:predicted RNA methylase